MGFSLCLQRCRLVLHPQMAPSLMEGAPLHRSQQILLREMQAERETQRLLMFFNVWTELEREQEKKIKSLHGCGWCLPCPFPTQTFEEVGSRGWEKGQPPQLSLHWYHCRNFSQYWEKKEQGATNPLWLLSHLCFFYHSKAWIHMNTGSLTPRIARLSALREAPKTTHPNSFRLFRGWLWMPKEVKESTHLFTFPYF